MVEEFGTSLSVVLGLEDDYLAIIVAGFLATGSDEQGPVGDTAGTWSRPQASPHSRSIGCSDASADAAA
jgi:hypothetical protein